MTKNRSFVLAKLYGCFVLIQVKRGGPGKCPACSTAEFRESKWSGSEWLECCNENCDFEVLAAHVREIENLPATSLTDSRP